MLSFIYQLLTRIQSQFLEEAIITSITLFFTNLIMALLTYAIFYLIWRIVERGLPTLFLRSGMDKTSATFINTVLKYTILTIGLLQAFSAANIDTSALLTSLGVAGLTIGFAARDALSNLISGILIFWDRPFVIGDLVEVDNKYGRVENITMRSTRIVTPQGHMLAVPNTVIINSTVASYTNAPHIRLDIDVTIAVTENIDRARKIILQIPAEDAAYMSDPAPKVVVTALNDYNIALQLQAWLIDEQGHIAKRHELREKLFNALTAAEVEMPLETIQLAPFQLHPNPLSI